MTKPRHIKHAVRDWNPALAKCRDEGTCRVCGSTIFDCAHLWSRALGGTEDPDNVAPLCRDHHNAFDQRDIDLGPYLTLSEKLKVVELAEIHGRRDGLNAAHERLFPSAHPLKKVAA